MKKYDNTQKAITAKRLKECRENKKLSHDKLAQELRNVYGLKISSAVLKNYEVSEEYHAKFTAGFGMNVNYLYTLADFFGVSTDYLLGLSDVPSPSASVQAINKEYGLTEKALNRLSQFNNLKKSNPSKNLKGRPIDFINLLLSSFSGFEIVSAATSYLWAEFESLNTKNDIESDEPLPFSPGAVTTAVEKNTRMVYEFDNDLLIASFMARVQTALETMRVEKRLVD